MLFPSQVVDLGDLVVERLFQVALRLDVAFHLAQSFDALHVACNSLLLGEEFVVGEPLDEVKELDEVEVEIANLRAKHVVLLADELDNWCNLSDSVLSKRVFVCLDIAGSSDVLLNFL